MVKSLLLKNLLSKAELKIIFRENSIIRALKAWNLFTGWIWVYVYSYGEDRVSPDCMYLVIMGDERQVQMNIYAPISIYIT